MSNQSDLRRDNNAGLVYVATDQRGQYQAAISATFNPEWVAGLVSDWIKEGWNVDRLPAEVVVRLREAREIDVVIRLKEVSG